MNEKTSRSWEKKGLNKMRFDSFPYVRRWFVFSKKIWARSEFHLVFRSICVRRLFVMCFRCESMLFFLLFMHSLSLLLVRTMAFGEKRHISSSSFYYYYCVLHVHCATFVLHVMFKGNLMGRGRYQKFRFENILYDFIDFVLETICYLQTRD